MLKDDVNGSKYFRHPIFVANIFESGGMYSAILDPIFVPFENARTQKEPIPLRYYVSAMNAGTMSP